MGGLVCHVMNRGVHKRRLFDQSGDYSAFLKVFGEAQERTPVRCLAYCVMPNHFHLVLWPRTDAELSSFMAWLTATHSKRWHAWRQTAGIGHVYQGRFKSIPVAGEFHFLALCRYVERNAVRAGLVERPEHWPWSSLAQRAGQLCPVSLEEWPVTRPPDWAELVQLEAAEQTQDLRKAISRSSPYGPEDWRVEISNKVQVSRSIAPVGRPGSRKKGNLS